jgi:NAD+ kinase
MRVRIFGRNKEDLYPLCREMGIVCDDENPEVVVSFGGDGTLLGAEREFPGVPKVALRDSRRCRICSHQSNEVILRHLAEGKLKRTEFLKLEAVAGSQSLTGLNDINLHNASITAGVRYRVWIDDEPYGSDELVGDGLVVATPFGSAAYYRSITHSTFRVGIGLAFNNTTEPINHLVLDENSAIEVEITRGPALLSADNDPVRVSLRTGERVTVHRATESATILVYDRVRYPADQFIY